MGRNRRDSDEKLELYRGWATVRLTEAQNELADHVAQDVAIHLMSDPQSSVPRLNYDLDDKTFCIVSFGPGATSTVACRNTQFIYRVAYLIHTKTPVVGVRVETYDFEQPHSCVAHIPS